MTKSEDDQLDRVLALSQRVVRTQQGSQRFNRPIGAIIRDLPTPEKSAKPVTVERIRSLFSQFNGAKSAGNTALAKQLLITLRSALGVYAQGREPGEVKSLLEGFQGKPKPAKDEKKK